MRRSVAWAVLALIMLAVPAAVFAQDLYLPLVLGKQFPIQTTPTATTTATVTSEPTHMPGQPLRLAFIHHSTGEAWLNDSLRAELNARNYFVVESDYGWGPLDEDVGYDAIGDHTDIGHWYNWFVGPHHGTYMGALYATDYNGDRNSGVTDPGGENAVIMFKSCFPNSALEGSPGDPPTSGANPLRGQDSGSQYHTVGNAKGIYNDLLGYFASRQDKLFVVITAPPLVEEGTDPAQAANARALNRWLVQEWLQGYSFDNVFVFDFYNVLTSNGGSPDVHDLGADGGNHHRYRNGVVEYVTDQGSDYAAYPTDDSHPNVMGNEKATGEFVPLLDLAVSCWQGRGGCNLLSGKGHS